MSGSARRRMHRRRMREEAARLAAVPLADIAARVTPSSAAAGRSNEYDRGSATVTRGHTGGPMPAGGLPLPTPARPIPASFTATHEAPTSVAHPGASQKGCPRLVPGGGQPKTPANTSARVKRMRSDEKVSPAAGGTRGPPKRACLARPKDPQSASLNYAGALKAHLNAVIVAADWRELSPDQMTIIRRAVELKHSEAVNDLTRDVVPAFDHFPQQLARGGLKLRCCDDYTLDWLKETVSSLPPLWDGGCQLKVVAASEMPSFIKGAVWVPDYTEESVEALRFHLSRVNRRWVDLNSWRLFSSDIREVEGVRCALLIFGIPQPEVERLELRERKLSYKVGTIHVKVSQGGGQAAETADVLATAAPSAPPGDTCDAVTAVADKPESGRERKSSGSSAGEWLGLGALGIRSPSTLSLSSATDEYMLGRDDDRATTPT
ncbi:hypothetical protein JYU34_022882 [Plutella xylostella]|uniref:DUF4780 domain-containing protein n=1 Tax=Plutella xylostella TaxID=51655 RepID=A0ABQ7PPB2_PLUXY|nr:hypothetical protein JYU34_022882 [Plutella xylostella]